MDGASWARREAVDSTSTRTAADDSAGQPGLPPRPQRLSAPLQRRDPDRYELLGEHGRGGLGTVTRAHDKELGRNVAIKELLKRGDAGEVRFLREAMITARLEHPGIVPVHEAGQWPDGTPFYVMKLVAGRPLKQMIAKCASVADRMALLHHVVAIADAIAYAHKRKIIHRDLKPSNVIVGDFGETVVVDWGLAKDLSEQDDVVPADERDPYRAPAMSDLTDAGEVLGTPMYMAPEQWRGERVDQRADVFAIGAILWELCSSHRVPPAEPRVRDKLLRRANIDADLIAIIGKAVARDPADRYQNAGELAADLRAFTSGMRIASRRYSLAGVAVHWIRHHRAIAAIAAAALVVVLIGATIYVRNIGVERDRSEALRHQSDRANDELVLQNAELLMPRDPSAVVDALASYRGKDTVRRDLLVAEARGRGVATERFAPHSDNLFFVHRAPDGSIYTLGEDRRVVVTKNGVSTTLATDASQTGVVGYNNGVLAYATAPTGVAVLDLTTRAAKRLGTEQPINLAVSSDGALLAALNPGGKLVVWNLASSQLVHKANLGDAFEILFSGSTLVAMSAAELMTIDLAARAPVLAKRALKPTSFNAAGGLIASGDDAGTITLHDHALAPIASATVCHSAVVNVRIVERRNLVIFACSERTAGVARYDARTRTIAVDYTTELEGSPLYADSDPDGRRMTVIIAPSTVLVVDLASRITRTLRGHGSRITAIGAPSDDVEHLVTGDSDGHVRVWSWEPTAARTLLQAPLPIYGVSSSPDGRVIVTDGFEGIVRRIDLTSGTIMELKGHSTEGVLRTRFASDGRSFFSVGYDGEIRVWDARTNAAVRVFAGHRGMVPDAEYLGPDTIVSAGSDGRLLAWTARGTDSTQLLVRPQALSMLETLVDRVVVSDASNAVFEVGLDGTSRQIVQPSTDTITLLRASTDGKRIAIGRASGAVVVYSTTGYRPVYASTITGSVHQIQFDPKNRDVAIQSDGGFVRIVGLGPRTLPWRELALDARDVSYSPDGDTLGIITGNGAIWVYSIRDDRWRFSPDHRATPISSRFTADGKRFVSTDVSGTLVSYDLHPTRSK